MSSLGWYLLLAPFAIVLNLIALVYTATQKSSRVLHLRGLLFCTVMILINSVAELLSKDPARILIFSHFAYFFVAFLPVTWLLFALDLYGARFLRPSLMVILLSIIPTATSALVWFDGNLRLIWREQSFERLGPHLINVVHSYGPWFWIHTGYSYGLFLFASLLLLSSVWRHQRLYRSQAILVVSGVALPLLWNLSYVFRISSTSIKDFSPIVSSLSGILFVVSMRTYRLGKTSHLPRTSVYEFMEEPVIILDEKCNVADINRAAMKVLDAQSQSCLGEPLCSIVPGLPETAFNENQSSFAVLGQGDRPLRLRIRTLRDDHLRCRGYSVTILDPATGQDAAAGPSSSDASTPAEQPSPGGTPRESPDAQLVFSRRERQVLDLINQNLSNKEIAELLFLSESTVKSHVHSLLKKTGFKRRSELWKLRD